LELEVLLKTPKQIEMCVIL